MPFSAVPVIVMVVVVAGIGFFGPKRSAGTGEQTLSARSVLSTPPTPMTFPSTVEPTTSSPDEPLPTSAATPAPTLGPNAVFAGAVVWAIWSPSGTAVAINTLEDLGSSRFGGFVSILNRARQRIDRFRADNFTWLDAGSYVAGTLEQTSDGDPSLLSAETFVGWAGSSQRVSFPSGSIVTGIGAGDRVAYMDVNGTEDRFWIWSAAGTLGPLPGRNWDFTEDGSLLAVSVGPKGWSSFSREGQNLPAVKGEIDVLDSSTGRVVARARDVLLPMSVPPAFSQDGRYMAYIQNPGVNGSPTRTRLLEIPTGRIWTVTSGSLGYFEWTDPTHLVQWCTETPSKATVHLPIDFRLMQTGRGGWTDTRSTVSPAGWKALWSDGGNAITIDKGTSGQATIEIGGPIKSVQLSPGGLDLLVVWGTVQLSAQGGGGYTETGQLVSILRP